MDLRRPTWLTTYSQSLIFQADNAYVYRFCCCDGKSLTANSLKPSMCVQFIGRTTNLASNHWRSSFSHRSSKNVEVTSSQSTSLAVFKSKLKTYLLVFPVFSWSGDCKVTKVHLALFHSKLNVNVNVIRTIFWSYQPDQMPKDGGSCSKPLKPDTIPVIQSQHSKHWWVWYQWHCSQHHTNSTCVQWNTENSKPNEPTNSANGSLVTVKYQKWKYNGVNESATEHLPSCSCSRLISIFICCWDRSSLVDCERSSSNSQLNNSLSRSWATFSAISSSRHFNITSCNSCSAQHNILYKFTTIYSYMVTVIYNFQYLFNEQIFQEIPIWGHVP